MMNGEEHKKYIIRNAFFSEANISLIEKDWTESFFKFHYFKYALAIDKTINIEDNKQVFYISNSKLLNSRINLLKKNTGEVERDVFSEIIFNEEVNHLGFTSIKTNKYFTEDMDNILEVHPNFKINNMLHYYKRLIPIVDFILNLTSFAEDRRLIWHRSEGNINGEFVTNYNTLTECFDDPETIPIINRQNFNKFLSLCLKESTLKNIKYFNLLIRSFLSGKNYSMNAKIVLWNSLIEMVLKKNFNKKKDKFKEPLLKEMKILMYDLRPIQDLIDIRNEVAHGDIPNHQNLIRLYQDWEKLIIRVILCELKAQSIESRVDYNPWLNE